MKRKILDFLSALFGSRKKKTKGKGQGLEAIDLIQYRLAQFMAERKPFTEPRYTIKRLAKDLKIPAYQISAFINHELGMNFSDYLNKLRVKYCEELMKRESGKKMNIQQLAAKCGFQNRSTFTNAFKKFTGRTPSEYIK